MKRSAEELFDTAFDQSLKAEKSLILHIMDLHTTSHFEEFINDTIEQQDSRVGDQALTVEDIIKAMQLALKQLKNGKR